MAEKRVCSIPTCDKRVFGHGWCEPHYKRWRKHGDPQADKPLKVMGQNSICTIEGCGRVARARGLCQMHNKRLKLYGSPFSTKTTATGEPRQFLTGVVLPHQGDECLIWPFNRNSAGYGAIWDSGECEYVHRLVCTEENGPAPTPEHEAAHSCGKGHMGCVARKHLIWKTPQQNHADKIIHDTHMRGERHPSSKLTADDVQAIRSLVGRSTQRELAARFGVSQGRISRIQNRKEWAWLR